MPDEKWFSETYADFKSADEHWSDSHDAVEFRYYGTELDEIVAKGCDIHLEAMDTGAWWMNVHTPDGRDFAVNLGVQRTKSAGERRDETWIAKHLSNWGFHEEDT